MIGRVWANDRVLEDALRAFTAGRSTFPTRREFDTAGRGDLRSAVTDYGGVPYWAERLGLSVSPRQLSREPFDMATAVAQAMAVIDDEGFLPGARTLRGQGLGRLATVVQAAGGARAFSRAHGLVWPEDQWARAADAQLERRPQS
jgi:hypothetical protein